MAIESKMSWMLTGMERELPDGRLCDQKNKNQARDNCITGWDRGREIMRRGAIHL